MSQYENDNPNRLTNEALLFLDDQGQFGERQGEQVVQLVDEPRALAHRVIHEAACLVTNKVHERKARYRLVQ